MPHTYLGVPRPKSAGDFAALEPQCRECLRTGEYDLLAELAQPHRLSELVDGNRVIDKSAGEREIRIVGTISDDDVSLTGIRQKHLFQIFDALRGDGGCCHRGLRQDHCRHGCFLQSAQPSF